MLRFDHEDLNSFDDRTVEKFLLQIEDLKSKSKLVCYSDYAKGVLNIIKENPKVVRDFEMITAGLKPQNVQALEHSDFLSFNSVEAKAMGLVSFSDEDLLRFLDTAGRIAPAKAVAVTRGGDGVTLSEKDGSIKHIPAHRVEVFDVAGAGDSFLAASSFALAGGQGLEKAVEFGNLVAAASVRQHGVVALSPEAILEELNRATM